MEVEEEFPLMHAPLPPRVKPAHIEALEKFIEETEHDTTDMTYEESWNYIKSGENSLKRHTNVNLLIKRFKEGRIG